ASCASRSPCRLSRPFSPPPAPHLCALSLHDALPILRAGAEDDVVTPQARAAVEAAVAELGLTEWVEARPQGLDSPVGQRGESLSDRKSTRLNSSHVKISYAVFCLKKKNQRRDTLERR